VKYAVIVQPPARLDIESAYLYIRDRAPLATERWLEGIEKAILSLDQFPRRCPLAPESKEFPEEIRQMLYGRRTGKYRVLFVIRGQEVRVLHVRHGARRWMRSDEIEP
jgi:plasmid stabilization system protein ParE